MTLLSSLATLNVGCKSEKPAAAPSTQTQSAASANTAPMSVDDLVAPIALYPDQLLAQVLTASTNPQEVLDGGNWLLQNQNLKGDALINAAKNAGFGTSMQYLMAFPQVVDNMCQEMDWTAQLGEAFNNDPKGVMDAIQRKRGLAQQMGNLTSSPQMTVESKRADNGQRYVEIRPADPKVVYVPQYNPVTIYNTQAPAVPAPAPSTTTVVTQESSVSAGTTVAIGLLSFGVGMAVGSNFNNKYYPYPAWGYGGIYYGGRPYYPPPYHPPYPAYRPAYGYYPPPNYPWTQYNKNVNVNINNNYYYRFQNQNSNQPSQLPTNATSGRPSTLPANTQLQQNQPNWKGQSTYQGAQATPARAQTPGASMANAVPPNINTRETNRGNASPASGGRSANATPSAGNSTPRSSTQPNANRPNNPTAGAANPPSPSTGNVAARPASPQNLNRGGDRGYGNATSAAAADRAAAAPGAGAAAQNRGGNAGGAFGGGTSGTSERSASNRGRASMGAGGNGRQPGGRQKGGGRQ